LLLVGMVVMRLSETDVVEAHVSGRSIKQQHFPLQSNSIRWILLISSPPSLRDDRIPEEAPVTSPSVFMRRIQTLCVRREVTQGLKPMILGN